MDIQDPVSRRPADALADTPADVPAGAAASAARSPGLTLVIVCLAQFMIVLDVTVVNIAAPSIQHTLHFSASNLQWVINAYTLTSGGFLLLGGRLGDLIGRRAIFQVGTVVFAAASMFNGLAPNSTALIIGRGVQGLGGALASPAALAVLLATFPGTRERTKALTAWSIIAVAGGAVGVLLGGVLTQYLSWRWIFYINVPVGALTLLASLRYVPESRSSEPRRGFDFPGAVTVTAGATLLVYALVQAPNWGWGSGKTIGSLLGAVALLAVCALIELRSKSPLVRPDIFRIRGLSVGNGVLMLVGGATFALFLFASLYVQEVLHYSPLRSGLSFLPVFGATMVGAAAAMQLIGKIGVRIVILAGLLIGAAGMIWLVDVSVTGSYAGSLLGPIIVGSIGLGIATVPLTQLATTGLPEELSGLASGVNDTAQAIGRSLGLGVLTSVEVSFASHALHGASAYDQLSAAVTGYKAGFVGSGILLVIGFAIVLLWLQPRYTAAFDAEARNPTKPAAEPVRG